jgi:hypothetical protein
VGTPKQYRRVSFVRSAEDKDLLKLLRAGAGLNQTQAIRLGLRYAAFDLGHGDKNHAELTACLRELVDQLRPYGPYNLELKLLMAQADALLE